MAHDARWAPPRAPGGARFSLCITVALLFAITTLSFGVPVAAHGQTSNGALSVVAATTSAPVGQVEVQGGVEEVIPDGSGGWFVSGSFTKVGGAARAGLARVAPGVRVDPDWRPVFSTPDAGDPRLRDIGVASGTLFVSGLFSAVNGVAPAGNPGSALAALDPTTGASKPWTPQPAMQPTLGMAAGADRVVLADVVGTSGAIEVGVYDARTATRIALHTIGGQLTDLRIVGGTLFIIGPTSVAGQPRSELAAVDLATGALTAWAPTVPPGFAARRVAVDGGTVFVGLLRETPSSGETPSIETVIAFDARTGDRVATCCSGSVGRTTSVNALVAHDGRVWVASDWFLSGGRYDRLRVLLGSSGAQLPRQTPGVSEQVSAMAVQGDQIAIAGGSATTPPPGTGPLRMRALARDFDAPRRVWAVAQSSDSARIVAAVTDDAGDTWGAPLEMSSPGSVDSLAIADGGRALIALTTTNSGQALQVSRDQGATWRPTGPRLGDASIVGTRRAVWLCADSRPYVTRDGGSKWTLRRVSGGCREIQPSPNGRDVLIIPAFARQGTLLQSSNGGRSWRRVRPRTAAGTTLSLPIFDHDRPRTIAGADTGIGHALWRSTNGGRSWKRAAALGRNVSVGAFRVAPAAGAGRLWIPARTGVRDGHLVSSNRGRTWRFYPRAKSRLSSSLPSVGLRSRLLQAQPAGVLVIRRGSLRGTLHRTSIPGLVRNASPDPSTGAGGR